MNAVVIAIAVMFILSLARVSVVLTLVISAIIGGLVAGLSLSDTVTAFNAGLGDGAEVALAYAVLGASLWHFQSQACLTYWPIN